MGSTRGNKIEPYYDIPTVASILGYDHPQSLKNALHLRRLDLSTFIVKGKLVVGKESFDRLMDERREAQMVLDDAQRVENKKVYMKEYQQDYRRGILRKKGRKDG